MTDGNPKCPHCGYKFDDDETWYGGLGTDDGDESLTECPTCEKPFVVCVYTVTRFESMEAEHFVQEPRT